MSFIEVEKSVKKEDWAMTDLHSHSHYEIYFLVSGQRKFFLDDKMYNVAAPCFIVIPPYTMHKTEGFAFSRININVSAETLDPYESSVLQRLSGKIIPLSKDNAESIFALLDNAVNICNTEDKYSPYKLDGLLSYIILCMDKVKAETVISPVKANTEKVSPIALKIIDFLSSHYAEQVSLDMLSKKFFLSKMSLCAYFKAAMNCTICEYIMQLRLNKAKQYLSSSKKSVEEIASLCGFSSGAYMGLIFKNKVGLSPLQYRKLQTSKI